MVLNASCFCSLAQIAVSSAGYQKGTGRAIDALAHDLERGFVSHTPSNKKSYLRNFFLTHRAAS